MHNCHSHPRASARGSLTPLSLPSLSLWLVRTGLNFCRFFFFALVCLYFSCKLYWPNFSVLVCRCLVGLFFNFFCPFICSHSLLSASFLPFICWWCCVRVFFFFFCKHSLLLTGDKVLVGLAFRGTFAEKTVRRVKVVAACAEPKEMTCSWQTAISFIER